MSGKVLKKVLKAPVNMVSRIPSIVASLRSPLTTTRITSAMGSHWTGDLAAWRQTIADVKAVVQLRKVLSYSGYPYSRIIKNQIGDGILNSAVAGLAVVAAAADPLLAGILVWGTRTVEYGIAVIWNQHMSSQRRQARLAVEGSETENKLRSKWNAAKELVSSCKYDFIAGASTIAGITVALVGGPISAVIVLGAAVAVCQTMSRFKEMSWGALRYIVNPNEELQKKVVDLQEPMSAFEMALNIGAMTLAYVAGFSAITAFYVFLPEVALPVSIALGVIGVSMMLKAKSKFRKEEQEAKAELEREHIWSQSYETLKSSFDEHQVTLSSPDRDERTARFEQLNNLLKDEMLDRPSNKLECLHDQLITLLEPEGEARSDLDRFFDPYELFEKVSLKDWSLEELANVYRTSDNAPVVDKDELSDWLYEQELLLSPCCM